MDSIVTPQLFGILSLITIAAGLIPYYVDIFRGNTKPHKAAMFIFAVLSAIAFSGQFAEGAKASLFFAGAMLFNQLFLFVLSLKYGMGGFNRMDRLSLILAGIVLLGWYFTKSAVVALVLVTVVNTIGKILVMIKVYKHPHTELLYAWYMSTVAGIFGALAVGEWNWVLLLVPLHNSLTVGIIACVIVLRRRRMKHSLQVA